MTTIVGVGTRENPYKPNSKLTDIVFGADEQSSYDVDIPHAHGTSRQQRTMYKSKIHVLPNQKAIVASAGSVDSALVDFMQALHENHIDLQKAIEQGGIPELEKLHTQSRWNHSNPTNDITKLAIAAHTNDGLGFYVAQPLGRIDKVPYITLGSGSQYIAHLFNPALNQQPRTFEEVVDFTHGALSQASYNDAGTSGWEIVTMHEDGTIIDQRKRINREAKKMRDTILDAIKKRTVPRK